MDVVILAKRKIQSNAKHTNPKVFAFLYPNFRNLFIYLVIYFDGFVIVAKFHVNNNSLSAPENVDFIAL